MSETPAINPEEMARQLRSNIQKERPRRSRIVLIFLAIGVAGLALLVWLVWPRPELPPLNVLAFDQLARSKEPALLQAWLAPQDPRLAMGDLGGLEVVFEAVPEGAGEPAWQVAARSTRSGQVNAQAPPVEGVQAFKVSFVSARPLYRKEDRARVVPWKRDVPGLLVEVAAVAVAGSEDWRVTRFRHIALQPAAADVLKAFQAKGYQIAYLAGAANPTEYRLMRAWVEDKAQDGSLAGGPVVGAPTGQWAEGLRPVQKQGELVAVAREPRLATALRDAGAKTFVLTDAAEVPPDTTRLAAWTDLPKPRTH